MIWQNSAPSNIALIKYMGKTDASQNLATNPSLSYTLPHLQTFVEVEQLDAPSDCWQPLVRDDIAPVELSKKGQDRFLKHVTALKHIFNYTGAFLIRSGNNFPSDCGLASSASSYAAVTKTMIQALCELTKTPLLQTNTQAHLSRKASGSSGRSFFEPWCLWDGDTLEAIHLPYQKLIHQVIVVEHEKKEVSSSDAHLRVATSHLFPGRPERAKLLLNELLDALNQQDWQKAYDICWAEFWDMHTLFETSRPSFGYMTTSSLEVLLKIRKLWHTEKRGPLITMDAGPNIHLLYLPNMIDLAKSVKDLFETKYLVLGNLKIN